MPKIQKVYIVSRQAYEEFYVFGVFTEKQLDRALVVLGNEYIAEAQEAKKEQEKWYTSTHLHWAKGKCSHGCEHIPYSLTVSLLEYSKSRFDVTEIEIDKVLKDGVWVV